jgi:hypothetical protein
VEDDHCNFSRKLNMSKNTPTLADLSGVVLGAAAAVCAASAGATIVKTTVNQSVAANMPATFDLDKNGSTDVTLNYSSLNGQAPFTSTRSVVFSSSGEVGTPVAAGTLSGPMNGASLTLDSTTTVAQFPSGDKNYTVDDQYLGKDLLLPFSFNAGGQTDFGFVDADILHAQAGDIYTVQVNSITFDNTGAAIVAGAAPSAGATVPEPSSILLLAAGAIGLAAYRRRSTAPSGV